MPKIPTMSAVVVMMCLWAISGAGAGVTQSLEAISYRLLDTSLTPKPPSPPSVGKEVKGEAMEDAIALLAQDGSRMEQLEKQLTHLRTMLEKDVEIRESQAPLKQEVAELRAELDSLRKEVQKTKSTASQQEEVSVKLHHLSHDLTNQQATLEWLRKSVVEVRKEVGEMDTNMNISAHLQQRQQIESGLALAKTDAAELRREMAALRAGKAEDSSVLRQLQSDVEEVQKRQREADLQYALLKQEVDEIKSELQLLQGPKKDLWSGLENNMHPDEPKGRRKPAGRQVRHEGKVRADLNRLRSAIEKVADEHDRLRKRHNELAVSQSVLQKSVRRMEKNWKHQKAAPTETLNPEANDLEEVQRRLDKLESKERHESSSLEMVEQRLSGLDKLHASSLQLFEAIESLEKKYDSTVADIRKEVSHLDINMAQLTSSFDGVKEEQASQVELLQAVKTSTASLQDSFRTEQLRWAGLQSQLTNISLQNGRRHVQQTLQNAKYTVDDRQNEVDSMDIHLQDWPQFFPVKNYSKLFPMLKNLGELHHRYEEIVNSLPYDCEAWKQVFPKSHPPSGLYPIGPRGSPEPVSVFCDMSPEEGWTVIQRRYNGKENFSRSWDDYKRGFGDPAGEYWIGNEALHHLTKDGCAQLQIQMRDLYGKRWNANYNMFVVGDEESQYRLHVEGYQGNASDALDYHQDMRFSTKDADHDTSGTNCADAYDGGWWFGQCQHANLNGDYVGITWFNRDQNEWVALTLSELKIRRRPECAGLH